MGAQALWDRTAISSHSVTAARPGPIWDARAGSLKRGAPNCTHDGPCTCSAHDSV